MKKALLLPLIALCLTGCASIENGLFATGLAVERAISGFDEKNIELSDHHWRYLEAGDSSQPTVVMVHGFGADKDNWLRMSRGLENYHIVAPDLPGHGDSSFSEDLFYGFDIQSRRLAEFIDALGLEKIHLVGNSMGGAVAALYAYRHPQRVSSLTLIDAVGFYGTQESELQKRIENKLPNPLIVRDEDGYDAFLDFVVEEKPFLPWPAKSVLGRKAAARQQANEHIFEHIHAEVEAARYAGGFGHVFSKLLMPTLVIWGEQDRVLDVSSVDKFYDYLTNVEIEVLPNTGHAPMVERPTLTAELIADFWARHANDRNASTATDDAFVAD